MPVGILRRNHNTTSIIPLAGTYGHAKRLSGLACAVNRPAPTLSALRDVLTRPKPMGSADGKMTVRKSVRT